MQPLHGGQVWASGAWHPEDSYALVVICSTGLASSSMVMRYDGQGLREISRDTSFGFTRVLWQPDSQQALVMGSPHARFRQA